MHLVTFLKEYAEAADDSAKERQMIEKRQKSMRQKYHKRR